MKKIIIKNSMLSLGICLFLLAGCRSMNRDIDAIPNAVPKKEPLCRYGNPECYEVEGKKYRVLKESKGYCKTGTASWYGMKFHGKRTSSREPYDMFSMTAASPNLPIPTYVQVTNLENGRKIIVKINDRGPFKSDRIIDLSYAAAKKLGFADSGSAQVEVKAIEPDQVDTQEQAPVILASANPSESFVEIKNNEQPVNLQRYLQLGAFQEKTNATQLQEQVVATTHETVSIHQANLNDKIIYRVQIGPFNSAEQSDQTLQKLKEQGFEKVITVFR